MELRIENRFLGDSAALSIPEGTAAVVEFPELFGSPYILLEPPAEGGAPLASGSEIPGFWATSFPEQIQLLTGQLSFRVDETLARTTELMDSVEGTLGRMDRTLVVTAEALPEILTHLNESMSAVEAIARKVDAQIDSTAPLLRASLDSANYLLGDSRRLLAGVDSLLLTSRPRAEAILASLDSASFLLNYFVREVAQRPLRILTGVPPPPPMVRDSIRPDTLSGHR